MTALIYFSKMQRYWKLLTEYHGLDIRIHTLGKELFLPQFKIFMNQRLTKPERNVLGRPEPKLGVEKTTYLTHIQYHRLYYMVADLHFHIRKFASLVKDLTDMEFDALPTEQKQAIDEFCSFLLGF